MPHDRSVRLPTILGTVAFLAVLGVLAVVAATSLSDGSLTGVAVAEPTAPAAETAPTGEPAPASPTPAATTLAGTPAPTPASSSMSAASPTSLSLTPAPVRTAPVGAFVLGDSISLSIAPALSLLGYPVTGKVGQSAATPYLSEHLSSPEAQQAPAWVIVLGTNNPGDEEDLASVEEWLRTIRSLRSPGQEVFWVTPYRPSTYTGGMSAWTLDALSERLRAEGIARPWLTVLDYASIAQEEWYALDGQHLHPDAVGQAALVNLIAGVGAPPADRPAPITTIAPPPRPEPGTGDPTPVEDESMEFSNS